MIKGILETINNKLTELEKQSDKMDELDLESKRAKVYGKAMLELSIAFPEISSILQAMREGQEKAFKKIEEMRRHQISVNANR